MDKSLETLMARFNELAGVKRLDGTPETGRGGVEAEIASCRQRIEDIDRFLGKEA